MIGYHDNTLERSRPKLTFLILQRRLNTLATFILHNSKGRTEKMEPLIVTKAPWLEAYGDQSKVTG